MTNEQRLQEFDAFQARVKARDEDLAKTRKEWGVPLELEDEPMPVRKVVQISTVGSSEHQCATLTALCDDGSMWMLGEESGWAKVPDIPQD